MCCALCEIFPCRSVRFLRLHPSAHREMPANHYHLCKYAAPCYFQCGECRMLVGEYVTPPKAHMTYGCCHRCKQYAGCEYLARHVQGARQFQGASSSP